MQFWIVGGGTGGHVYPALAVTQALLDIAPESEITWIGTVDGMERELVEREGFRFLGIPGGGLHGVALLNAIRNGWDLTRSVFVVGRRMRRERPDAILSTGGFVSGPVAVAARYLRVPSLVFVPDIEPARSVKTIGRWAKRVAVTVSASLPYFLEGKGEVTGYPLGERITRWSRAKGREALGLDSEEPMLLVFGGSRGARSINRAVMAQVDELTELAHVVHVTGKLDWPEIEGAYGRLPDAIRQRYNVYAYLHERMGAALAAADLVVSRAGASVLGEFPYFGLPAILVPYPHAWRYQRVNAAWLADRGAAIVVEDADLTQAMVPAVRDLLTDEVRRARMSTAARELARPEAANSVAQMLLNLGAA
ncbi:MAG: undecaprenyldiphospho-muramoylpentapeptide beta-N-acetylglucosaminyltransferase [Anaerolineae bacterium]